MEKIDWQELLFKFRWQIVFLLLGLILVAGGLILAKSDIFSPKPQIEILESVSEGEGANKHVIVEIAGSVEKPGVYKLPASSRIEDLLIACGGVSADADREWMEKTLNRAAKLVDGQKIFIPAFAKASAGGPRETQNNGTAVAGSYISELININTASQKELETLWGIGPVTAQNIIEHRPYSSVEELLSKKILKTNVYERTKDKLSVY